MSYALPFLRVVIGAICFAHGAQKLLGWWGGGGLKGTAAASAAVILSALRTSPPAPEPAA